MMLFALCNALGLICFAIGYGAGYHAGWFYTERKYDTATRGKGE